MEVSAVQGLVKQMSVSPSPDGVTVEGTDEGAVSSTVYKL